MVVDFGGFNLTIFTDIETAIIPSGITCPRFSWCDLASVDFCSFDHQIAKCVWCIFPLALNPVGLCKPYPLIHGRLLFQWRWGTPSYSYPWYVCSRWTRTQRIESNTSDTYSVGGKFAREEAIYSNSAFSVTAATWILLSFFPLDTELAV